MNSKKVSPVPQRTDTFFMQNVLNMAFNARIGLILMSCVTILLIFLVFSLVRRPPQVVVIDKTTGQTFAPVAIRTGMVQELIDRQLVYYSTQVCESYFDMDVKTAAQSHRVVYDLGSNQFRAKLGEKWLTPLGNDNDVLMKKTQTLIHWEMTPRVTKRADPYYTVFATIQRVVKEDGLVKEYKKFNVRIEWGRLNQNVDYTKRPHSLVLLDIQILNEGSADLNEQINLLGK
jgi:hypothetical protein